MSREIKFRAWHPGDGLYKRQFVDIFGLAPHGSLMDISFSGEIHESRNHPNIRKTPQRRTSINVPMAPVILMQFTGLKDRNGVDIYEGDIVRNIAGYVATVQWGDAKWETFYQPNTAGYTKGWHSQVSMSHDYEVIGNIYENPELLK